MVLDLPGPIVYWFDTCSFMELRRSYPRPAFDPVWDFVVELLQSRRILSVEDVYLELKQQDDEIAQWIDRWKANFIILDDDIQNRAREILSQFPTLIDIKRGKSSADPFLIAAALVRRGIIVTEENRSGGPNKVKIPDVAGRLNIQCLKLLQLLQREHFRSVAPPA